MEHLREHPAHFDTALEYAARGYRPVPCRPLSKEPAVKWRPYQQQPPTEEDLWAWFGGDSDANVALITAGLVVFDVDDVTKAKLVLEHCGDTPYKVKTPSGGLHFGYRARRGVAIGNKTDIKGVDIDIRATEKGLALVPWSRTEKGTYEWLGDGLPAFADLPIAKVGWTRERTRVRTLAPVEPSPDDAIMVRRAWAWTACVEGCVSGQRGHDRLFRVVCKMLHPLPRGFGLTLEQAWPILLAFNEQCEPPWSLRELEHKVSDALKKI